ncbi:MAG: histidine kinase [Acidimicrobiales bacterium]|nr:histidine kinase [Acidimicrobiales bacterium]
MLDGALLLGVTGLGFVDLAAGNDGASIPASPVVSLLVISFVALRRRWPVGTMAATVALILAVALRRATGVGVAAWDPLAGPVAALSIMVAPMIRRQPQPMALAAGLAGAAAAISVLLRPVDEAVLLAIPVAGTYLTGVVVGLYLRDLERRQRAAADGARHHERLDLARELHDLVAHEVAGIVVRAQAAQVVAGRDPTAAGSALDQIEVAGKDALAAMRRVVGALRDADAEPGIATTAPPVGLGELPGLVSASTAVGLTVDLHVDPAATRAVPGAVAASAHRIVQESLTNVRRHAQGATRAWVDLRLRSGDLVVTINDDGHRLAGNRAAPAGFGLVGMQERAQALGGTLHAGPVDPPAHGWEVQALLPLGSPAAGGRR